MLGTWICERVGYRKDTLVISEDSVHWETEWLNGQSESSTMQYNDSEFYDSNSRMPYIFENGEIIVTFYDGSTATFER